MFALLVRAGRLALPAVVLTLLVLPKNAAAATDANSLRVIMALIQEEHYDVALRLAEASGDDEKNRHEYVDFTRALILKRQHKYEQAVALLRALLDANPQLVQVRTQLAHTLYLLGRSDAAIYHFELLSEAASNDNDREFYEKFIQLSQSSRPWNVGGYITIAPSSNVSNSTAANIVRIGGIPFRPTQREESGIGLNYGLNGSYRVELPNNYTIVFGGGVSGSQYRVKAYDTTQFDAFAVLARDFDGWSLGLGVSGEHILKAWTSYRTGFGPFVTAKYSFGRFGTTSARLSWKKLDYSSANAYDGSEANFIVKHHVALSSASSLGVSASIGYVTAATQFNEYRKFGAGVSFVHEWPGGFVSDFNADITRRNYVGNFPLMGIPRDDTIYTLSAGLTFRMLNFKGFAPRLEFSYLYNRSNVELYDYHKSSAALTLSKRF